MFGRIKRAIGNRVASYVSDNTARILTDRRLAEERLQGARDACEDHRKTIKSLARQVTDSHEMLATQSHLREQAENEIERLTEERDSLTEQLKAADAAAQMLREELSAERADLAEVRHELEKTGKQLELATEENRLLSEIHETDFQRRRKEKELEITQGELAIAEARRYTTEQQLEAA